MNGNKRWKFFSPQLLKDIRERFCCVESDPYNGKRIYFENAGGSLTLKKVVELLNQYTPLPDSENRPSLAAIPLKEMVNKGKEDVKKFLGVDDGQVISSETASRVIFLIVGTIISNIPGKNVVTTFLEHPSNYDACSFYAQKTGKELRVANVNPIDGGVNLEEILSQVDTNTCLLSFLAASNITGKVLDIENIVKEARKINPNLYIFLDATQHVAHAPTDVKKWGVDGVGFTPYKVFGKRGLGLGWVSERVASLPHEKILEKADDNWGLGSIEPAAFGAWSATIDYICWLGKHFTEEEDDRRALILSGMKSIELHERALLERALNGTDGIKGLRKMDEIKVHFLPKSEDLAARDCLISMTIGGKRTSDVVQEYLKNGVIVYDRVRTNPMSRRTLDSVNLKEVIRVTPLHCNKKEEIDEFLKITQNIAKNKNLK